MCFRHFYGCTNCYFEMETEDENYIEEGIRKKIQGRCAKGQHPRYEVNPIKAYAPVCSAKNQKAGSAPYASSCIHTRIWFSPRLAQA